MKRIVILGAGESGAGAAVLAKKEGFEVFVSDLSPIKDKYKKLLDDHQIAWEESHHTEEKILHADEIIKSPGIPDTAPMMVKVKERGIPVISEIEFAGRYTTSKMICITGSNGKTTTMPDWLATSATRWLCRWLKIHTNTTSSSCLPSSWTTCTTSVPMWPSC